MTLGTKTIGTTFNAKALAATALLLPAMLWSPFTASAGDSGQATQAIQVAPQAPAQPTAATPVADTVSPSYFEADKDGVLWFRRGTDGKDPYSETLSLSHKKETIIILVDTNKAILDKALEHGKKLQEWLNSHPMGPSKDGKSVDLVIATDRESGTFYYFNVIDMPYWNDKKSADKNHINPARNKLAF